MSKYLAFLGILLSALVLFAGCVSKAQSAGEAGGGAGSESETLAGLEGDLASLGEDPLLADESATFEENIFG